MSSASFDKIKSILKNQWGFSLFLLSSLVSFIQLLNPRHWGHYKIFSGAALALWAGQTPFAQDFGSGVGYWFYSLSCGLFYYGPFAALPLGLGVFVYMLSSWVLFLIGVVYFVKVAKSSPHFQVVTQPFDNWIWLWLSFFVMSAILAEKLELTMVGLFFIATAWLIRGRFVGASAFLYGMMINWKFQPLPIVGLIVFVLALSQFKKALRFFFCTLLSVAFWFALPVVFLGPTKVAQFSKEWSLTLQEQLSRDWSRFQHLFKLPLYFFKDALSLADLQRFSAICGVILIIVVGLWLKKARTVWNFQSQTLVKWGLMLAMGLGSWFIVALSPMSETNAFVLVAPLFIVTGLLYQAAADAKLKKLLFWNVQFGGFTMALLGSDIFGKHSRIFFTELGIRPWGATVFTVILVMSFFQVRQLSSRPS
jgi:hypothetical protein